MPAQRDRRTALESSTSIDTIPRMDHTRIVQAIIGTEVPMLVVHDLAHQARQHAAQVPATANQAYAERRALVALAITHAAQQQWQQLLGAAHGDDMLVHDHVTALALACDWSHERQLVRLTEDVQITTHWHRRIPAELWRDNLEQAYQTIARSAPPLTSSEAVSTLKNELRQACQALADEYLTLLDDYCWYEGMVVCQRPVQNIGGYLRRSITRAAAQQRQQQIRDGSDPEWFDTAPTTARQTGFFSELCDALRSLPTAEVSWQRDATAWLLQGELVYRDEAEQNALQHEYLGEPSALAMLAPEQALTQVANGLAQAYEDLWIADPLLAAHWRCKETSSAEPWKRRPAKEISGQIEKFAVWALEAILRYHSGDTDVPATDLCPPHAIDNVEMFLDAEEVGEDFLMLIQKNHQAVWAAAQQAAVAEPPDTAQLQQYAANLLNLPPKGSVYRVRLKRAGDALRAAHAAAHPLYRQAQETK
jgi:hypothetical protein